MEIMPALLKSLGNMFHFQAEHDKDRFLCPQPPFDVLVSYDGRSSDVGCPCNPLCLCW